MICPAGSIVLYSGMCSTSATCDASNSVTTTLDIGRNKCFNL